MLRTLVLFSYSGTPISGMLNLLYQSSNVFHFLILFLSLLISIWVLTWSVLVIHSVGPSSLFFISKSIFFLLFMIFPLSVVTSFLRFLNSNLCSFFHIWFSSCLLANFEIKIYGFDIFYGYLSLAFFQCLLGMV